MSFPCPRCLHNKTVVTNTLGASRRRMCPECGHKFETTEVVAGSALQGQGGDDVPHKVTPTVAEPPKVDAKFQEYADVMRRATARTADGQWSEEKIKRGYKAAVAAGTIDEVIAENRAWVASLPPPEVYEDEQEDYGT